MKPKLVYQISLLSLVRKKMIRQHFNQLELYCGQEHFLRYIGHHPGCKQSDLAEAFHISAASVSISTGRMEKMEIIRKEMNAERIRENNLYLTSKGEALLSKIKAFFMDLDQQMLQAIDEQDIELMEHDIDQMLINLTGKTSEELDIRNFLTDEGGESSHENAK